eukprot:692737-Alexandrium_andersonii.AAC.1
MQIRARSGQEAFTLLEPSLSRAVCGSGLWSQAAACPLRSLGPSFHGRMRACERGWCRSSPMPARR